MQVMGYLSGPSPHIKSGAVSALSVLIYNDTDICQLVPDLVPSVLTLLQSKGVEIIKVSESCSSIIYYLPSFLVCLSVCLNRGFWAGCFGLCEGISIKPSIKGPENFPSRHC